MADYIVDIIVEGSWVVLKANGHEIERTNFGSIIQAKEYATQFAAYAHRRVAEIRAANGQTTEPKR